MRPGRLLVLAAAALLLSCTPRKIRQARRLEGRYLVGHPQGEAWSPVDPGGADYAWYNQRSRAAIYTDSNCGSRFEDASLDSLLGHLLHGLGGGAPLVEERLSVGGREALLQVREGRVDGMSTRVAAVVLKKDGCTFDLVYLASPEQFQDDLQPLREVMEGFTTLWTQP